MRKSRLTRAARVGPRIDPAVFFFSVSFLLGGIAGYFSCRAMGIDAEIRTYLTRYAEVLSSGGAITAASVLSVAAAYYRVPCVVFLCRSFRRAFYWHCGVFLLEGFLLSFAVSSLTLALGRTGVLVSLCVFGVRLLFVLPVSLSLALLGRSAGEESSGRRMTRSGRKRESNRLRFLFVYPALLALGVMVELTFVPKLAAFALLHIS